MRDKLPMLAIDFDDTLFLRNTEILPGEKIKTAKCPIIGAKEALDILYPDYQILIYSCRHLSTRPFKEEKMLDMIENLKRYEFKYDHIVSEEEGKPLVDLYIDDRGLRFTDWTSVLREIWRLKRTDYE